MKKVAKYAMLFAFGFAATHALIAVIEPEASANPPQFCCSQAIPGGDWQCTPTADPDADCFHGSDLICAY